MPCPAHSCTRVITLCNADRSEAMQAAQAGSETLSGSAITLQARHWLSSARGAAGHALLTWALPTGRRPQRRRRLEQKTWLRRWAANAPRLNSHGARARPAAVPRLHPPAMLLPAASASSSSSTTFLATGIAGRATTAASAAAEAAQAASSRLRKGRRHRCGAGRSAGLGWSGAAAGWHPTSWIFATLGCGMAARHSSPLRVHAGHSLAQPRY